VYGQPGHLFFNDSKKFPPGEQIQGAWNSGRCFNQWQRRKLPAMAKSGPASRGIEPRCQSKRGVQGATLAGKLEEGGLKSIFGGMRFDKYALTNSENGSSMFTDETLECLRIARVAIPTEQLGIASFTGGDGDQPVEFMCSLEICHNGGPKHLDWDVIHNKRLREPRSTWKKVG
jgi:hypothetical protein